MNKFIQLILSVVTVSLLAISTAPAQNKAQPAAAGKIDEKTAKSLVLKKYPGANIVQTSESTLKGKSVWVVSFMSIGGSTAQKVAVDEDSGVITRM